MQTFYSKHQQQQIVGFVNKKKMTFDKISPKLREVIVEIIKHQKKW